ncbi:hypothetical protein V2J09_008684 [Rumex salicifolius]
MAATATTSEVASGSLICKTWVLKVYIHCEGCKREVKKALQKLEGVYKISVDSQQNEVRVTGNITSEALLNKLSRMGKHAEIVHDKSPGKQKPEKGEKLGLQRACLSGELPSNNVNGNSNGGQRNAHISAASSQAAAGDTSRKTSKNSSPGDGAVSRIDNNGKGQKKGNANNAMPNTGSMNHKQGKTKTEGVKEKEDSSPKAKQSQTTIPEPTEADSGPSQEIVLSYNSAHLSSGKTHDLYHQYVTSQPSVYSDGDKVKTVVQGQLLQEEVRQQQQSFDMFSEENANGCSIM